MCLICERVEMIKQGKNRYFVKELETGYVVIGDHQHFKGYTLFLCKEHKSELFYLDRDVRMLFLKEMSIVCEAVSKAFQADKMNVECLGNGDAHLHWHLFPRVDGDLKEYGNAGKGPVWWYPMEEMMKEENVPDDASLSEMKQKLLVELDKLLLNEKKSMNHLE